MSGKKTIEESDFGNQCGRTDLKSLFFFFLRERAQIASLEKSGCHIDQLREWLDNF